MTDDRQKLYGSRTSDLEFLFNKADAKIDADENGGTEFVGREKLLNAFPAILAGKSFVDQALTRLDSSPQFGAMIVRTDKQDGKDGKTEHDLTEAFYMDIAEAIDAVCGNENGIWGRLENDLFGCFFPGKGVALCLQFSDSIRKLLLKRRKETVSIGIAEYPFINFSKGQILDNARKALDHAGFFGADSTVSFDAVSLNISGDKFYQSGDIHGAIREFTTALMIEPSNINVRNSLGVCYGILGDHEKAKEEFETAAWLDPEAVMPVYNTGLVTILTGDKEKALGIFHEANGLDEDVFEVVFQIGRLYTEMGDYEKAKPFLEKASLLKPESGIAFRYLGECFTEMGMANEAVTAYKKSVRQNPNDADSLSALGHLFELQGENQEIAMMFCKQSVEISPDNGLFRHRLGKLYLKGNRLDDALKEFKEASNLGFDSTQHIEEVESLMLNN